jgi:glucitol operon activator protein
MNLIGQVAIVALISWLLQLALAYRQARLFYKHVNSLRKLGRCATSVSGSRYRWRTYVILVAHPQTQTIIKAERLRGLTVFARLKPVLQLEGRTLDELLAPDLSIEGVPSAVMEAARSAAETIQESLNKVPATV